MLFNDKDNDYEDIYKKLLSDKLDINLGFLYENAVAQIIKATNRDLYFHTWRKKIRHIHMKEASCYQVMTLKMKICYYLNKYIYCHL